MADAYDNLEEYIRQSEPDVRERGRIWQTAIGLQDVDGLSVSDYLVDTAKRNIDGDITAREAAQLVDSYYEGRSRRSAGDRTEEADKVASRIAEFLSEDAFVFSVNQLLAIHGKLFAGIYEFAGKVRDYNISKREWVLNGRSVTYAGADMICQTLDYDFEQERAFDYRGLSSDEAVDHLAAFVAYLWQIHPFGEGNTRVTAVFTIKYLRTLGFQVDNSPFHRHSWYFRNALVRANYSDIAAGIYEDRSFLIAFFRNLLLDEDNELKNRYLHIAFQPATWKKDEGQRRDVGINVGRNSLTNTEERVMNAMRANPHATLVAIAEQLGMSKRHIERVVSDLRKRGLIERVGANKKAIGRCWLRSGKACTAEGYRVGRR